MSKKSKYEVFFMFKDGRKEKIAVVANEQAAYDLIVSYNRQGLMNVFYQEF